MSYKKFLSVFLLTIIIPASVAWAAVIHRDTDFGDFVKLKNRVEATGVQPSVFAQPPASTKGFYILQFNGPVEESWKKKISSLGVKFLGYVPDNAFIVKIPQRSFSAVQSDPNVKWLGEYQPDDKLDRKIATDIQTGQTAVKKFVVKVFDGEDMSPIINSIQSLGGEVEVISDKDELNGKILQRNNRRSKGSRTSPQYPSVEFIEEKPIPVLYNNIAVQPTQMNVTPVWSLPVPLTGTGQVVGILDTGIDTGNTSDIHPAFSGNVSNGQPKIKHVFTYGRTGDWSDPDGHGTHTSGSLAGMAPPPLQSYSVKGVAYDAQIVLQSALTSGGGLYIPYLDSTTLGAAPFLDPYNQGVRVHSNSWGETDPNGHPLPGQYTSNSLGADTFAWNHKDFLAVFAAGNDGKDANGNGIVDLGSIDPPATAKNVLAVGASENSRGSISVSPYTTYGVFGFSSNPLKTDLMANNPEGMVAFSSRGPTGDGRIKPDVVAPGTWVLSTKSTIAPVTNSKGYLTYWGYPSDIGLPLAMDSWFAFDGGTSMATPLTAGAAAIVRQYYTDKLISPSAALIKATIINGATNMTGQYASPYNDVTGWPDNNQGFGRVNLARSVTPDSSLDYVDDNAGLTDSGIDTYYFSVIDTAAPVRVTLVWTDPPATLAAATKLVNDLDLEVTAPNGVDVYHGNIPGINPANFDHLNNVEAVEIPVSGLTSGVFTVTVIGDNVPTSPQPYALAIRNGKKTAISPLNKSYGKDGGSGSITVTASVPWTAVSNDDTWLRLTSGSSGTGNGTVDYTVDPYDGKSFRTGTITVAGATFTVTQTGVQDLSISVSPGGSGTTNYSNGPQDYNTTISILATANPGFTFSGWTVNGTPTGSTNPLPLKMDGDKIVVANFVNQGISPWLYTEPVNGHIDRYHVLQWTAGRRQKHNFL